MAAAEAAAAEVAAAAAAVTAVSRGRALGLPSRVGLRRIRSTRLGCHGGSGGAVAADGGAAVA